MKTTINCENKSLHTGCIIAVRLKSSYPSTTDVILEKDGIEISVRSNDTPETVYSRFLREREKSRMEENKH